MAISEESPAPLDESPTAVTLPVEASGASAGADVKPVVHRALAHGVGLSGVDGIPARYADGRQWLEHGIRRHPKGALVALFFAWTGFWLALWGAAIGAVLGVLIALGAISSPSLGHSLLGIAVGQTVTPLAVVSGLVLGVLGGFIVVIGWIIFNQPVQWITGMLAGLIVAVIIMVTVAAYERLGLRLRGYRRLSRDEVRRVAPLVREVAEAMDLDGLPRFAMADLVVPNAWTHMRTIVLTTGLLQSLDDGELRAVLAHELRHWRTGDSVGLTLVWCCAWPIALTFDIGMAIAGRKSDGSAKALRIRGGLTSIIGWGIAWPAWVILKLAIVPAIATTQRRYEYEADASAAKLGYAAQLSSALRKMSAFESGRTGWERAMAATHPPTELRIEALQEPRPDDAEYQEDELRGPSIVELQLFLKPLIPLRAPVLGNVPWRGRAR